MACHLWKIENGVPVKEVVAAQDVANLLETQGYKSSESDFTEGDINGDGELTNDEVRQTAKSAGIQKWETSRISTLKRELGYDD